MAIFNLLKLIAVICNY